ncbi:peroxide stress protein YaaA [Nocardioides marmoribigeumensis]
MRVIVLLPPSEGKATPRRGAPLDLRSLSFPDLTPARERVLDALVALCRDEPARAAEVLGLGPTQAEAVTRNATLREAPTTRADRLYTGVLYDALDLATLDVAARRRAARWLLVTSGLFGFVRPGDRVPAYRLSGDVTLPGLGGVARHWSQHLGAAVEEAAGRGLVVDLRSSSYAAFWRPDREWAPRVATVRVLHEHQGTRKVVSHFNKATKGRLVRSLLEEGATPSSPARLAEVLRDLGWTVEVPETDDRRPTQLDVVVSEV